MASVNGFVDVKVRFRRTLIAYNFIRCLIKKPVQVPGFFISISKPYFKKVEK